MIRGGADAFVTEQLLDIIAARFPEARQAVVDGGGHWVQVERYLTDAHELLASSTRAQDFYDGMLARHPDRLNPGALWGAAITLFGEP